MIGFNSTMLSINASYVQVSCLIYQVNKITFYSLAIKFNTNNKTYIGSVSKSSCLSANKKLRMTCSTRQNTTIHMLLTSII